VPSPFPGMDPYLERPSLWPGFHVAFISKLQEVLNPRLLPNFIAQIETRVYVVRDEDPGSRLFLAEVSVEKPCKVKNRREPVSALMVAEPVVFPFELEIEIEEARIEIKDRRHNMLVAVIEVLSPSNKIRGSEGRASFLSKRNEIMASPVHWVEIDLLREGSPSIFPLAPPSDYRVYLSQADDRRRTRGWPISLREKLPAIGVPLDKHEVRVPLDLAAVLNGVYDQAGYEYLVDYTQSPEPPLSTPDAKWANALLRA